MKNLKYYFLFVGVILSFSLSAQTIPNASFEIWTPNNLGGLSPQNWHTINSLSFSNVLEVDGLDGGVAAELRLVSIPEAGIPPASLYSNSFVIGEKYSKFKLFIKGMPLGNDTLTIGITMNDDAGVPIGFGAGQVRNEIPEFTEYTIPIIYTSQTPPKSCQIVFQVHGVNEDSYYTLDDLSLTEPASAINELSPVFATVGNAFPNPAVHNVEIPFELVEPDQVTVTVFDGKGSMVLFQRERTFQSGSNTLKFDVSAFVSGTYFFSLTPSDGLSAVGKFVVE